MRSAVSRNATKRMERTAAAMERRTEDSVNQAQANPHSVPPSGGEEALPRRFGKYTLIRKVAAGGMAELYLALHKSVAGFEKLVAVKRVLPHLAEDEAFVQMLLQEARVAAQLDHPNIAHIFDVGVHQGEYYIAMEFVHGEDLRSIVRQMKKKEVTSFPLEHTLAIVLGCCAGLAYAHEKKDLDGEPLHIVHRDVSPQNILVTFTGDVKLVDFGIAKVGAQMEDTGSGKIKGKIPYMSPEQARGGDIDHRSDIFSLGVILFELSTGRRLFRGRNEMDTIRLITESTYPRPREFNPHLPEALEAIILKALEKDPERRYASAHAMQADLEAFVREHQIPVSPLSLGQWMQTLFEEKLAQQKKLLQEGRQLAEVIAAQLAEEDTATETAFGSRVRSKGRSSKVWALAAAALGTMAALALLLFQGRAPTKGPGVISISSEPPGAAIWLDGERRPERTPTRIEGLPVGTSYELKLTKEGHRPHVVRIHPTEANPHVSVRAELEPLAAQALGVVSIRSEPPGARIVLNGKETGKRTPATLDGLEPGVEHTLGLLLDGYEPRSVRVRLAPGKLETLRVSLPRAPVPEDEALLVLRTEPPQAKATLDGQPIERAPSGLLEIRVPPGRHELLVRLPHYKSKRERLELPGGRITEWSVTLERERRRAPRAQEPQPTAEAQAPAGPGRLTFDARPWCNVTVAGRRLGQTPIVNASLPAGRHRLLCVNPELGVRKTLTIQIQPGKTTRRRIRLR